MNFKSGPPAQQDGWRAGNDLYRKKQYDEAIRSYEKSLLSANKAVEAALNYNIGNCKFRQGKTKESSDLAGAIAQYRSSLDYYKRAMELAPQDKEAKFNHEFVEKLLKKLLDKLSKQQKQQEQKSGQQEQKSEAQQQKEKQEQQKESQSQAAKQQEDQQRKDQQQPQREIGGKIAESGKEPDKEMSREEAGVLLDDYRQREQQDRQLSDKHKPQRYPDVEKDW